MYSTTRVLVQFEPNKVFPMAENDLGIQYDSTVGDSTLRYTITDSSSVGAKVEQLSKVAGARQRSRSMGSGPCQGGAR